MGSPNDATIDIPLTNVTANTGNRKADAYPFPGQPTGSSAYLPNEKAGLFNHHTGEGRRRINTDDHVKFEDDGTLTRMGRIYNKILNFSIVTRYFVYVLPLAILIAVPIIIGATVAPNAKLPSGGVRIVWIFTWVEVVWLSLWVSKIVAKTLPSVFQFLCGIVSSGTRKYALVLESLEIPLSLAGWALASLGTFIPLMTHNPDQIKGDTSPTPWEEVVNHILAAFLASSLVLLCEKLLIQLISIGYHRKQFDTKITDSKHSIFLLSLLYDASRSLFPAYCDEFAEEDYIINDSINIPISKSASGHIRSGSQTPLRLLQNVGRVGDKITAAFGNIAHEVTGKQVFNPTSAHSIVVEALEKNKSSEALARRIWMSFVVEGKESLFQEDIAEVLGPDRQNEAEECFASLDRDGNGDISLDEMILTVCEIGRERKSIASSLHDVDQAINVLDDLLCFVVFIICVFVFVAFLNTSFTTTLATAGTALLSLSFVFATTAQEVLGSCIFLFVKHPFDVGDRVDIGDEQLVVERISLLFTVFKRIKTHKTTQVPNLLLNGVWIDNVTRSKAMREQLLMYISFDTTIEDIQLLKNEMQTFVLQKDNSRDFQPEIDVEVTGIASMDKLELKVEIKHKSNWANEAVRAARRSKFMCALVLALRKVPIYAPGGGGAALGSSDMPTYSVAVSDAEAAASRDAFAKAKEANRLIPTKQPNAPAPVISISTISNQSSSSTLRNRSPTITTTAPQTAETAASTGLNSRNPASDPAHDWETDIKISSPPDAQGRRSNEIEEVRDILRRESTRGKRSSRQTISPKKQSDVPTIAEPVGRVPGGGTTYHDYATTSGIGIHQIPEQLTTEGFGATLNPYLQGQRQQQPQPQQQSPPYSSQPETPTSPTQGNPYQLQMQARRPLLNGNNSFAQERAERNNPFVQGRGTELP